ncbi:MAG: hypothetical protein QM780_11230 [Hyphomicrobium sp.]|uniref:hypothetical protein n=1 Tax=Hyphomicrobium sp. TaxID=82 RepID=UPI0039E4D613
MDFALATAAALVSSPVSADDRLQSSFTELVGKGFEVKSVTLIPLEVAKRVTEKVKTDNVIVTLQKQEAVAVCYIAFANWAFMNKTSLDSPTLCEVRASTTEESAAPAAATPPSAAAEAPPAAPTPEPTPEATSPPSPPAAPATNP